MHIITIPLEALKMKSHIIPDGNRMNIHMIIMGMWKPEYMSPVMKMMTESRMKALTTSPMKESMMVTVM